MGKNPILKIDTVEFLGDAFLSLCSPSSRGIWFDIFCALKRYDPGVAIEGTAQQLARLSRASEAELLDAIKELGRFGLLEIEEKISSGLVRYKTYSLKLKFDPTGGV